MAKPDQRLGEYILIERISAGAFGEVWRGHHNAWIEQIVAIKIPTDPQYVRNLQKEGSAVHRLSHPNIVKAIAFDPYGDPPYLVMEFVPGASLRTLIQRGPMHVDHAVAVMKQVLAALHHAHEHGLVHRDIKPENILIHKAVSKKGFVNGTVKLTDFGLGKVAAQSLNSIVMSQDLREGKQIVGSAQYMAPEQRDGDEVDARADLYACGVVFFEMLTGKRPAGMEVPSDVNADVPQYLDEIFRRAYARLERRFNSAEEFFNALDEPVEAEALPVSGATPAQDDWGAQPAHDDPLAQLHAAVEDAPPSALIDATIGRLLIVRSSAMTGATYSIRVFVEGQHMSNVVDGGSLALDLPAGTHVVRAVGGGLARSARIWIAPGKTTRYKMYFSSWGVLGGGINLKPA